MTNSTKSLKTKNPSPLEQADPELGKLIKWWCNLPKEDKHGLRIDDRPVLTDTVVVEKKIKRNAPCVCGSGKKYKKCCGK